MPARWLSGIEHVDLKGANRKVTGQIAERQECTAREILRRLSSQPGLVLADEVGMGKTYVAMSVIASAIISEREGKKHDPVVVMVPPALKTKWIRDWRTFQADHVNIADKGWLSDETAQEGSDFFRILEKPLRKRPGLIFVTPRCFAGALGDPLIKLGFIKLAKDEAGLGAGTEGRLIRWAQELVRQKTRLNEQVLQSLMNASLKDWEGVLESHGIPMAGPVPDRFTKVVSARLDLGELAAFVKKLPAWSPEKVSLERKGDQKERFRRIIAGLYREWLSAVPWRCPLLVLDEAHHAKNERTQLARLFRESSDDAVAALNDNFDRMLFLTATPFELGHGELVKILRHFSAVRWKSAPTRFSGREEFFEETGRLEQALDLNQQAARRFNEGWGSLDRIAGAQAPPPGADLNLWWNNLGNEPENPGLTGLKDSFARCLETKSKAEGLLSPWIIRHNREEFFQPGERGEAAGPRRSRYQGSAISDPEPAAGQDTGSVTGLAISEEHVWPFLIAARSWNALARLDYDASHFADGLVSSYEAFHYTREGLTPAEGPSGEEAQRVPRRAGGGTAEDTAEIEWYADLLNKLIPGRDDPPEKLLAHPKVSATVNRALRIWRGGEKVLVFCFYRQTARALSRHLERETESLVRESLAEKIGLESGGQDDEIDLRLRQLRRILAGKNSPVQKPFADIVRALLKRSEIPEAYWARIIRITRAYLGTPQSLLRYLPPDFTRRLLPAARGGPDRPEEGITGEDVLSALNQAEDDSGLSFLGKIKIFLDFCQELAKRSANGAALPGEPDQDEPEAPLEHYLDSISSCAKMSTASGPGTDSKASAIRVRVRPTVHRVDGQTEPALRDRIMLAFNSPMFPEILVTTQVLGEGVDLHRFCRHVIHHDLDWNPSRLEQRVGRLDRVRSKSEATRKPIDIYEPFLAGSADEKMFRVVTDRERWFKVVMGQKYAGSAAPDDRESERRLLPKELARALTFDLSCWRKNK
jgi:superfamily II DNA or RNA helicase